jgi:hypothetical protein
MPLLSEVVVKLKAGIIVIVSGCVTDCAGLPLSVTLTENETIPELVGVPVIAPVDAFKLSPPGKAPLVIDHVNGAWPFWAASVTL